MIEVVLFEEQRISKMGNVNESNVKLASTTPSSSSANNNSRNSNTGKRQAVHIGERAKTDNADKLGKRYELHADSFMREHVTSGWS